VHRLEQGKNFTLDTLIKIAGFLELHPKELLDAPYENDFKQIEKSIDDKRKRRVVAQKDCDRKKGDFSLMK